KKKLAAKHLKAVADVAKIVPIICADEARLREVFDNLLDNAVKYSSKSGEIRLEADRVGDQIALSVSDDGIGISQEDLPRIFERFYRGDKARSREQGPGGSGLGLAICQAIVSALEGQITVQSRPGEGSVFVVTLPLNAAGKRGQGPLKSS